MANSPIRLGTTYYFWFAPLAPLPVNDVSFALVGACVTAEGPQRPDRGQSSMEGFPRSRHTAWLKGARRVLKECCELNS
eukprot:1123546-Rhodomonas_salina.1